MKREKTFGKTVCLPAVIGLVGMMGVWTSCHDDKTIIGDREAESGVIENTERPTTIGCNGLCVYQGMQCNSDRRRSHLDGKGLYRPMQL